MLVDCLRLIGKAICVLVVVTSSITGFAQYYGTWVGDEFAIWPADNGKRVFVDENNKIIREIPLITASQDLPVPVGYFSSLGIPDWYNGAEYVVVPSRYSSEDGVQHRRWSFAKYENDKWHYLGEYIPPDLESLRAIPCSNNRFIIVSRSRDLYNNNRANRSPFALGRFPDGKTDFRITNSIDHGQEDLRQFMSNDFCFNLAYNCEIFMTAEHATLINTATGLYWVFSLEKASLVKTGNIFKSVTPKMVADGGFNEAILWFSPEKAGTVLMSAVDENFFLTDKGNLLSEYYVWGKDFGDTVANEKWKQRQQELRERNPWIDWYRLYPENGRVEKLSGPPPGGSSERGKEDRWRPLPDGSVRMGVVIINGDKSGGTIVE